MSSSISAPRCGPITSSSRDRCASSCTRRVPASQYSSSSFSSRVTQKFLRGSHRTPGSTRSVSPADRNMYAVPVGIAGVPSCPFTSMTSLLLLSGRAYPANTSRHPTRSLWEPQSSPPAIDEIRFAEYTSNAGLISSSEFAAPSEGSHVSECTPEPRTRFRNLQLASRIRRGWPRFVPTADAWAHKEEELWCEGSEEDIFGHSPAHGRAPDPAAPGGASV